jgi:hypothetical protein
MLPCHPRVACSFPAFGIHMLATVCNAHRAAEMFMIPRPKRNKLLSTLPAEADKPLRWRHALAVRLPYPPGAVRPKQGVETRGTSIGSRAVGK